MRTRLLSLLSLALLLASAARADGGFLCRWLPGAPRVSYGALEPKQAAGSEVRALLQGALLVAPDGRFPRFPSISQDAPVRETEALACHDIGPAPAHGMIELTFTRPVRFGIDQALGRCQLFFRCPATDPTGPADAPAPAPEPLLEYLPAPPMAGAPAR